MDQDKCPKCKTIVTTEEHRNSLYVCTNCNHHSRQVIEYFNILFDNNKFKELDKDMTSLDPLKFSDKKSYLRLKSMKEKTGLNDAKNCIWKWKKKILLQHVWIFFYGGSMGSVVGEKISRAIDFAIKKSCPIIIISKSGGARMMEAVFR